MSKPIIAFDLDDVLVDSTEFWRVEVNKRTGANILPEHFMVPGEYSSYYERLWQEHKIDHLFSIDELDNQMIIDQSGIQPFKGAHSVLVRLSENYTLIAVTARNADQQPETLRWLERAYPAMFSDVAFGNGSVGLKKKNKGEICVELGASWLIDDNAGHCNDALNRGVRSLLFGDYGWNQPELVGSEILRVKDWAAVLEYFDGIS